MPFSRSHGSVLRNASYQPIDGFQHKVEPIFSPLVENCEWLNNTGLQFIHLAFLSLWLRTA